MAKVPLATNGCAAFAPKVMVWLGLGDGEGRLHLRRGGVVDVAGLVGLEVQVPAARRVMVAPLVPLAVQTAAWSRRT